MVIIWAILIAVIIGTIAFIILALVSGMKFTRGSFGDAGIERAESWQKQIQDQHTKEISDYWDKKKHRKGVYFGLGRFLVWDTTGRSETDPEKLKERELRITEKKHKGGHPAAGKVHPVQGHTTHGIRRGGFGTDPGNKPAKKTKTGELPKWITGGK